MRARLISTTRPSIAISLFAEPSLAPRAPSSYAFSIVTHGLIAGAVLTGHLRVPEIKNPSLLDHYDVRQLDLHPLDPKFPSLPPSAKPQVPYPHLDPHDAGDTLPSNLKDAMHPFVASAAGRQTIIQPEVHTRASLAQPVPLPNLMIWTPGRMPKQIVAPPPDPDTSSYVTPSLDLPTQELKLSDVAVASIDQSPRIEAMPATTTSPIETQTVKPVQKPLVTVSTSADQPTPAALLSVSDIRLEEGKVFLPPVNDIAKSAAGEPGKLPGKGSGNSSSNGTAEAAAAGADAEALSEADSMTIDGRRLSSENIVMPRDGKFSVVVVGSAMGDDNPDMPDVWGSRVAYTAYLHVGLNKNWILQYSATRAAEMAAGGSIGRLEAPWPYEIKRPNLLTRDLNADALMVHGILNQSGRLESLAIVFPSGFRYSAYVLYALRQWQFRPARQNGQPTPVEILLIIPDDRD